MDNYVTHHTRFAIQFDPKFGSPIGLTFYVKSKQGKCKDIENDRIFIIGIHNHKTDNFEEFACTEEEWFLVLDLMCSNDLRPKAQKRYIKRLRQLATKLEEMGSKSLINNLSSLHEVLEA